ncbi:MAG: S8 family serine peptidase [Candidatus Kerfeldbacteria bacterium]|nr:S8 family serine peptidase [Candidatus Kerfeldbacteria bacterium]
MDERLVLRFALVIRRVSSVGAPALGLLVGMVAAVWAVGVWAETVPGQLLVRLKPAARHVAQHSLPRFGLAQTVRRVGRTDLVVVEVDPRRTSEVMARLAADRRVASVQPNYVYRLLFTPNDPSLVYQWNFIKVEAAAAWDFDGTAPLYGGDPSVVVAVLDTGVAFENYQSFVKAPDLAGTTFVTGTDLVNDDDHPNDDHGHGTHVAGTIGETTNNGVAAAGLAFASSIMPVKVLDSSGLGTTADIAAGVDFARTNGADIINLSLGGSSDDPALKTAIQNAVNAGIIVVAATGNDGATSLSYPARYDTVISVGATRYDNTLAPYSNYGAGLDLVAPGGDLDLDQNNDGQPDGILQQTCSSAACTSFNDYYYEGTSQAAPHVSAAAALLLAAGIQPANVRALLEGSATDLGTTGYETTYGWGLLNVNRALSVGLNDTTAPNGSVSVAGGVSYTKATSVALTLSAADQQSNVVAMSFSNDGTAFSDWEPYATSRLAWDLTATGGSNAEGLHRVSARFRDAAGNISVVSSDDITLDYTKPSKPLLSAHAPAPYEQVHLISGVSTSTKSFVATWTASTDALSGLAGYRAVLSPKDDVDPGEAVLSETTAYTSLPLDSSRTLYLRVAAYDQAGNDSEVVTFVYVYQQLRIAAGTATNGGTAAVVQTSGKVDTRVTPFGLQRTNGLSVASLTYSPGEPDQLAVAPRRRVRTIKIITPTGKALASFSPYNQTVDGGLNLASADLDGDGRSELLVAPRSDRLPLRIFSANGKLIREINPFGRNYRDGMSVAVADDGGEPQIVVGRLSGKPTVRILSQRGAFKRQFSAFSKGATHGVNVAAGDLNGDGHDEIVATKPSGSSEVRVYTLQKKLRKRFLVFSKKYDRGLDVATGDFDGDGRHEILTVPASGAAQVHIHSSEGRLIKRFFALPKSFRGGASLASVQ